MLRENKNVSHRSKEGRGQVGEWEENWDNEEKYTLVKGIVHHGSKTVGKN